jgi:hypothetical protein
MSLALSRDGSELTWTEVFSTGTTVFKTVQVYTRVP